MRPSWRYHGSAGGCSAGAALAAIEQDFITRRVAALVVEWTYDQLYVCDARFFGMRLETTHGNRGVLIMPTGNPSPEITSAIGNARRDRNAARTLDRVHSAH